MKLNRKKMDLILCQKGLRQSEAAVLVGVSRPRFYAIMASDVLRPSTVYKVAKGLGVNVEDIIEQEG